MYVLPALPKRILRYVELLVRIPVSKRVDNEPSTIHWEACEQEVDIKNSLGHGDASYGRKKKRRRYEFWRRGVEEYRAKYMRAATMTDEEDSSRIVRRVEGVCKPIIGFGVSTGIWIGSGPEES